VCKSNKFPSRLVKFRAGSDMAEVVNRRLLTAEDQAQYQGSACGICGGQTHLGLVLFAVRRIYPATYHFTYVP
jgi:hypothetical protein